jgi:DNA/RNA non-specific endonuclease
MVLIDIVCLLHRPRSTRAKCCVDWAYLEDWCRRLTETFQDVYVFTVPLYLPRLESDGKWRVVGVCSITFLSTTYRCADS